MKKIFVLFITITAALAFQMFLNRYAKANSEGIEPAGKYYLFSFFRDNEVNRGGAGLYLAWSADGLEWKEIGSGNVLFKPAASSMMRDPSIARGPDGVFHMVWTTGWHGEERGIGYASSRDLVNWSPDRIIKLMEDEPAARNFWAPELFYDGATGKFLIFWATTIPGRFPKTDSFGDGGFNHRIYYITTTNFEKFTAARLLYEPGFNCIDAAIVKDGDEYVMFVKNETRWPVKKYIVVAKSSAAEGPYGKPSKPLTPSWSEGPTAIKVNDKWFVYFDMYALHNYGVAVSRDLKNWNDLSTKLKVPKDIRHGTAFEVDGKTLSILLERNK